MVAAGSFLEMQNLRAHSRHSETDSLFYTDSLVICMYIKIEEVLSQWLPNPNDSILGVKYICKSVCFSHSLSPSNLN